MSDHWRMLARYNAWANARLYAAAAALPAGGFEADGGAFFGSLKGTLNHLLVTDRIWMRRFTGEGDAPAQLDAILHDEFGPLRAAREAEDRRIVAWIDGLVAERLSDVVSYRRVSSPDVMEQPLVEALAHLFNHQTHHRGQAHALLTRFAGPDAGPVLDLLAFQRETRTPR